jgi:pentatricopeptide repeat protein
LLLAGAYANAGNPKKALEVYEQLDSQNKLNEVYTATAAGVAEQAKDYAKAIELYKKAKAKADPATTDQIQTYNIMISELEKKL